MLFHLINFLIGGLNVKAAVFLRFFDFIQRVVLIKLNYIVINCRAIIFQKINRFATNYLHRFSSHNFTSSAFANCICQIFDCQIDMFVLVVADNKSHDFAIGQDRVYPKARRLVKCWMTKIEPVGLWIVDRFQIIITDTITLVEHRIVVDTLPAQQAAGRFEFSLVIINGLIWLEHDSVMLNEQFHRIAFPKAQSAANFFRNHNASKIINTANNSSCSHFFDSPFIILVRMRRFPTVRHKCYMCSNQPACSGV
nr:MAG TPA: hypothetical protein [Caudoviricetes sp.]